MLYKLTAKKRNKWLMLMVSGIMAMSLLAACGKDELNPSISFDVSGGEQVATYKDGTITDLEFNKFKNSLALTQGMDPSVLDTAGYREYILEQYIVYKVLASRATQEQKDAAKEEAVTSFTQYEEGMKSSGADLKEQLKTYDLSRNDVATFMMMGSAATKYIDSQVTEDMMKAEYEKNKADYTLYDIRQIVVNLSVQDATKGETVTRTEEEALARAQEVKQKLEAGGSWEELAKEYSDDTTSKENGGVYADYFGGRWYDEVKQAAYTQELNKIGEPVLSAVGYHVIKVEKRDVLEYDQLADTTLDMIRYVLSNEVMNTFITDELPGLEVNITLPPVEGAEGTEGTDGAESTDEAGDANGNAAGEEQGEAEATK